jgi:SAM-dependent methyltransferase
MNTACDAMAADASRTGQAPAVRDIDELFRPTHDERARQGFISVMRNHAKSVMRDRMLEAYQQRHLPDFVARHGREPADGREVERFMADDLYYNVYSNLRYNAQRMMYLSTIPAIERSLPQMVGFAKEVARTRPAGGSLRLDPSLEIPRYVSALDVHLIPGGFHSEYVEDDVAQGLMIAFGGQVSRGANRFRRQDPGGVARSIGYWLSKSDPAFAPRRILDLGTQSGKNLLPYLDIFPAAEAHGVDVSAPTLRYGHVKAECQGKAVHFSQQNAESMDYPDGMFDLIVSSFFFHELPVAATRRILAECRRLLAPGGRMVHMELPPHADCDPWLNFYWDWDAKHNNEPFYMDFRSQDLRALVEEAGFPAAGFFTTTVPDTSTFDLARYPDFLAGKVKAPLHGRGGWFVFGASL